MNAFYKFLKKHHRINLLYTKLATNMLFCRIYWFLVILPKTIIGYILFHKTKLDSEARYEVIKEIDAGGLIYYKAPFTGGFNCKIMPSTILIKCLHYPASPSFSCIPENKSDFEKSNISQDILNDSKYNGYNLIIPCKFTKNYLRQL